MQIKLKQILFVLVILSPTILNSQERKVSGNINNIISAARAGDMENSADLLFQEENIGFTLQEVMPYTSDSVMLVRNRAYWIINRAGNASKNDMEIAKCVEALSKGCHDKAAGIAIYCAKALWNYERGYFTVKAKESIGSALFPKSKTLPNIAMLIGYLGLQESTGRLQSIAYSETESRKNNWYAHLALARMGNKTSIDYCLGVYKSQAMNSELIENMVPELLYTRQKEVYNEIIKVLYSNEKDCLSGNPDNERGIPCGYWVMEQIGPYIEGYPLETHASGAIKGGGYQGALEELRLWFQNNKDYNITDNSF